MINRNLGTSLGRQRRPFMIREHLDAKGVTYLDVAKLAGLKSASVVSQTIRGNMNNRKILSALKDLGVPVEFLALPPELMSQT